MSYLIVYIGAGWCSTCKTIKPATTQLAKRYNIELKCLDYDEDLSHDEQETVTKVPTLRIFQGGEKVAEYSVNQVAQLTDWLSKHIVLTGDDTEF